MLSSEIPPPDLPCPCEIPRLRSDTSVDERASDDNQHQLELDLFKAGLDDNYPLPKFSIRDYVSTKRGKDIFTNWPFSQKNLQLCLKHGVKDVLPPFQSLDSVRNPPRSDQAVRNKNGLDVGIDDGRSDRLLSAINSDVGEKQAVNLDNCNSIGSQEDKNLRLTKSCSDSDINLVPLIKSHLKPEAENLAESCVGKPESSVLVSKKIERNVRNPVKNCKLVVKLSKIAAAGSNEHLSVSSAVVTETMASKVCPVCKTFSSSSDTTLNVHIDQCLLGVSTVEWASSSKVSKHRIKPRKMKLMEDIYATALHCTLEDLDRRNGTKWASNLGFPAQELEVHAEEMQIDPADNVKQRNEEGTVYVDSSGTKFLSLSKFSDLPSKHISKDYCGARKLIKRDKQTKFPSKNTKIFVRKHKNSKYPVETQICSSTRPNRCPEDNDFCLQNSFSEEGYEEAGIMQPVKVCDQMKSDERGAIKHWMGAKKPGFKSSNLEHENHAPDKTAKNVELKGCRSSHGDSLMKPFSDSNSPVISDENPHVSPFDRHKRKENSLYPLDDDCRKHFFIRKRVGLSSLDSQNCDGKDKAVSEQASFGLGGSPGKHKFSSLKKKWSVTRASVSELKDKLTRRHLNFKKPRLHYVSESDEEEVLPRSAIRRQDSRTEKVIGNAAKMGKYYCQSSTKRTTVLKHRKEKLRLLNTDKEASMTPEGSETASESSGSYSRGFQENADSFMGDDVYESTSYLLDVSKEVAIEDEFSCAPNAQRADGEAFVAFGKSLNSTIHQLAGPSDIDCSSQGYVKAYGECYQAELLLSRELHMFSADKAVENVVIPETCTVARLDTDEGLGNYFVDVDPIPIPGPPGSFLPSPGRMSSEELQGNSSLTTCRIQSSDDKPEMADIDSSNSPFSSPSMASESAISGSGPLSATNLSERQLSVQQGSFCNVSEDRINPVAESLYPFEQSCHAEAKADGLDESRSNFKLATMSPHGFKNSQPCCCSRKEGAIQTDLLNYQESQLLKQQTIASLPRSAQENYMDCGPIEKVYNINLKPETLLEKVPCPKSGIRCTLAPILVSHNSETRFPNSGDSEFPSPSTQNPVLRLMGKNIMVMNKDEDVSPQTWSMLRMVNDHPSLLNTYNVDSTVVFPNDHSFAHISSQVPPLFDPVKPSAMAQPLQIKSSHGFEGIATSGINGSTLHPPTVKLTNECHGYAGGCNMTAELGPKIGADTHMTYNIGKVRTTGGQVIRTADFHCKLKEMIGADDLQETKASLAIRATQGDPVMDARGSSIGISESMVFGHGSIHVNPLFANQAWGYSLCNGSRVVHTSNFRKPFSNRMAKNSVKWNCNLKATSVPHPNSLMASSPSSSPRRSISNISPGFS